MSYYDPDRYQLEYIWLSVSDKVLRRGRWEECYASSTYTSSEPVPISNNSLWHDYGGIGNIVPDDIVWYAEDCVWTIDKESVSALQSFLFDMFNDKNLSLVYDPDAPSYGQLWIEDLYDNGTRSIFTSETYAAQLARSLTVYTRLRKRECGRDGYMYRGSVGMDRLPCHTRTRFPRDNHLADEEE
jgi:hypothetical protein